MNVLAMFAKHWRPGTVKTRLAARWGEQAASEIYLACLRSLLRRFAASGEERWLAFTPAEARAPFAELAGADWRLVQQASGDLGERMHALFAEAFGRGVNRVVLIGSDSPTLPLANVRQAFELLDDASVVLGPARDGGYCLIGARDTVPPVFEGIDWSTPRVFAQTALRLQRAGVAWAALPDWHDIDTPADLEHLRDELRTTSDPELIALRTEIERGIRRDP